MTETNRVHRFRVATVGDRFVFGTAYDGVDHRRGETRDLCFRRSGRDVAADDVVRITYERERTVEDLPPVLVGVDSLEVLERDAGPEFRLHP